MPFYAQRADLPDTHKLWADPGSEYERVLRHLGYVSVSAPGEPEPPALLPTGEVVRPNPPRR